MAEPVLARAEQVLALLEEGEQAGAAARLANDLPLFAARPAAPPAAAPDPLRTRLEAADLDGLTPRAALELLYALRAEAETETGAPPAEAEGTA